MKNVCIILLMALVACQPAPDSNKNTPEAPSPDSSYQTTPAPNDGPAGKLVVKNEADYSPAFLALLRENTDFEKFYLDGNLMVVNDADTAYFSQEPPIGKSLVFTAKKESLAIAVRLKRINQTTVDYTIEMVESGKPAYFESGQADISPFFFLGAESDESDVSGESYMVTEFTATKGDCHTSIRIGQEENTSTGLLGKLIKNCNGKLRDIDLDNFPMLREK